MFTDELASLAFSFSIIIVIKPDRISISWTLSLDQAIFYKSNLNVAVKLLPLSSAIRDEVMPDPELEAGALCVCVCAGEIAWVGTTEWTMGRTAQSWMKTARTTTTKPTCCCVWRCYVIGGRRELRGNRWRSSPSAASESPKLQPLCTSVSDVRLVWNNLAGGTSHSGAGTDIWAILCTMAAVKVKTHEICPGESRWWREKRKLCSLHHLDSALWVQKRAAAARAHVCRVPDFLLRNKTATPWQGGRWKSEVFGTRLTPNITSLSPDKLRTERCLSAFFLLDREEVSAGVVLEEKTHTQRVFFEQDGS